MSISGIGSAAAYAAPVNRQAPTPPASRTSGLTPAGSDADGDNDGSRGGTVDVRA
jgi:hypothetical protein